MVRSIEIAGGNFSRFHADGVVVGSARVYQQGHIDDSTPLTGRQPELVKHQGLDWMPEGTVVQWQCNSSYATKVRKSLAEDPPDRRGREGILKP